MRISNNINTSDDDDDDDGGGRGNAWGEAALAEWLWLRLRAPSSCPWLRCAGKAAMASRLGWRGVVGLCAHAARSAKLRLMGGCRNHHTPAI